MNIDTFTNSYLITAAWITCESDECDEFTADAEASAKADCEKFFALVRAEFGEPLATELLSIGGIDLDNRTAHDLFLTRNGHGAGFWDSPEIYGGQDIADRLTGIAKEMGAVEVYHIRGKKSKLAHE